MKREEMLLPSVAAAGLFLFLFYFFFKFFLLFYFYFVEQFRLKVPPPPPVFLLAQPLLRSLRLVLHTIHTHVAHINTPRALLCSCSRCACPSPFLNPHPHNKFHPLAVRFLLLGLLWMAAATFSFTFCVALLLYCLNAARLRAIQLCLLEIVGAPKQS